MRFSRWRSRPRARRALAAAGAMTMASWLAAACGGSSSAPGNDAVAAHLGNLEIVHPFLPDPASPSVAAVYLTVRNTGSSPDALVSVSTPVTHSASLMTENSNGTMTPLVNLPIPAHGSASLAPGHNHLMLENLSTPFTVGEALTVTLRFSRAGVVTVEVPVVPLSAITDDGGMSGM